MGLSLGNPGKVVGSIFLVLALYAATACFPPSGHFLEVDQRLVEDGGEDLFRLAEILRPREDDNGGGPEIESDRLSTALRKTWKLDLGGEVRNALLAPPGLPIERTVLLEKDSVLSFSYGIRSSPDKPAVDFRIGIRLPDGALRTLFEDRIEAGTSNSEWRTGQVDLSDFADRRVTLQLDTLTDEPLDLAQCLPLWSTLEILRPAPRKLPPNVILISLDTLRADHLELYGYSRKTSPRLTDWAESKAVVFKNAIAPSPWTLPSHISLFTGQDTLTHNVNYTSKPSSDLQMLAESLRKAGYTTLAVTGGGNLNPKFGLAQGFERYRYWLPSRDGPKTEELETGVDQALEWLTTESRRPFFLFFHTYEIHSPYHARLPYFLDYQNGQGPISINPISTHAFPIAVKRDFYHRKWFAWLKTSNSGDDTLLEPSEIPEVVKRYDSSIAYTDQQLGRLLDYLETARLDRETAVVITSDHGEALGEKSLGGHAALYDFILRVPLIIGLPKSAAGGKVVERQVRLIDVAPTILELAGLPPPDNADGTTLLPLVNGSAPTFPREAWSYAASSNYGLSIRVENRLKYIYNDTAFRQVYGIEELFDLAHDEAEEKNLQQRLDEYAHLRAKVLDRLQNSRSGLEIRLTNNTSTLFSGSLFSADLRAAKIKSWGRKCNCLDWRPHTLVFELPSGSETEVLLLDLGGTEIFHISGSFGPRKGEAAARELPFLEDTLALGELDESWQVELRDGAWSGSEPPSSTPLAAIRIRWRGAPVKADRQAVEPDEQLRSQLRALGYID